MDEERQTSDNIERNPDGDRGTQSSISDNLPEQLEGMYMDCWDDTDPNFQNNADPEGQEGSSGSTSTVFERAIGALEDIVIKPSFQTLYNAFLDSNYTKFSKDETQINQDQNFDIFMHYASTIGSYLENEIKKRVEEFDMEQFVTELRSRPDLMDNEIIEMVFSLMDYTKFNELILDYSAMKADDGKLGSLITVRKIEKPVGEI